jgi:Flp pilus assembly protein TadG
VKSRPALRLTRGVRRTSDENGASAVEFALLMPVLTLIIFGIISFGIVFAQQLALGNATRQGARFGAADSTKNCADIVTETSSALANTLAMSVSGVTYQVKRGSTEATATDVCGSTPLSNTTTKPCTSSSATDNLYVRASYTSTMITPFVQPSLNLTSAGSFRCEFS